MLVVRLRATSILGYCCILISWPILSATWQNSVVWWMSPIQS